MQVQVVRPGESPDGPPRLIVIYGEDYETELITKILDAIVEVIQTETQQEDTSA